MHVLSILDIKDQLKELVEKTKEVKSYPKRFERALDGKVAILLFEKPSTRTRVSFEVGIAQMNGKSIFLSAQEAQLSRGETIEDTARVLSRYCDCIIARVGKHETLERLKSYASIPVINALSDLEHPCQALADIFTMFEVKGSFKELQQSKVCYVGDPNNVFNSLLLASVSLGINFSAAFPKEFPPRKSVVTKAFEISRETGSNIELLNDPRLAAKDADFIYTDVWVSMGHESEAKRRLEIFREYQINSSLLKFAKKDTKVMHCLPANRGKEITSDVLDDERVSIVFQQAENRLYVQKALLLRIFEQ